MNKDLQDWTLEEIVAYNAGREILAIGQGTFMDAVFASADLVLKWKALRDGAATYPPPPTQRSIDDMEFSVRTAKGLKRENILTVGELLMKTRKELMSIPRMGRKSVNEVEERLAGYGRTLKQTR